jgi:hypothetical protein
VKDDTAPFEALVAELNDLMYLDVMGAGLRPGSESNRRPAA